MALIVAALVTRLFTSGAGIELHQPGTQLLFDALALCGAFTIVLASVLDKRPPLRSAGWALPALLAFALCLLVGGLRAPDADLGSRTALSWVSLLLAALTLRELGRTPGLARGLAALLIGSVFAAALLGLYGYFVTQPALLELYQSGKLEVGAHGSGFAQAFHERIHSRAAVGTFLLPGLLATGLLAALPLLLLAAARAWRDRKAPGALLTLPGIVILLLAVGATLVLTKSKGAVVTAAGVTTVLALLHPRLAAQRRKLLMACGAVGALIAIGGIGAYLAGPERIGVGLSLQVRLEYWDAGLSMWTDHPVAGVGLNGFREYYSLYKSVKAEEALHAHNAVVQLLAELGLVGLLTFLALGVGWVWDGVRGVAGEAKAGGGDAETGAPAATAAETDDAPATAAEPDTGADASAPPWALAGAGFGLFLGLVLLAGFGDVVNATSLTELAIVATCVPLGTVLAERALRPLSPRVLGAAAVAGASALLFDGLLNFGLYHPGVFVLTFSLAALAPSLARAELPSFDPRPLRAAAAALIGVLALGVLLLEVPGSLLADTERELARQAHQELARLVREGETEAANAAAVQAVRHYEAALDGRPSDARTWLEQAALLGDVARLAERQGLDAAPQLRADAVASARRATELAPLGAGTWSELGTLLGAASDASTGDLRASAAAHAEAVRLYPYHPTYALLAAEATLRLRAALGEGHAEAPALTEQAKALLDAAEAASQETRLVRLKLTEAQRARIQRLRSSL